HENLADASVQVSASMNMVSGIEHGTPMGNAAGSLDTDGNFSAMAYFLMPSQMNGNKMGDWSLNVTVNGVTKAFPIEVNGMPAMQKLQGDESDQIETMDGSLVKRPYYIFKRALTTMPTMSSLEVYVAARETMMKYAAIKEGSTLNDGHNSAQLTLDTVSVSMCITDCDDAGNWQAATASAEQDGVYKTDFMTQANEGVQVRLIINGAEKLKGDGSTASFSATAMSM
ncbi:MAG: hypothetical protein RPR40_04870, partial [Bermanella sp.]